MPRSMIQRSSLKLVAVALLLLAAPAGAELFTVTLTTGSTFETRYQPVQSAVDEGKLQLLTDTGNWISLDKEIVVSITSETESKGFGTVIDTQTIALGWDPTSLVLQEEAEAAESQDPTTRLLNYLMEQEQARSASETPFSNQPFVEPSEAGGIPLWMTGVTTPPIGRQ
jgi:hypothetical protein